MCDSQLLYNYHTNQNSHRIENVITSSDPDKKMAWWQSQNGKFKILEKIELSEGSSPELVSSAGVHHVSIQLDLETVFQFSHLVLTFKVKICSFTSVSQHIIVEGVKEVFRANHKFFLGGALLIIQWSRSCV